MRTQHELVGLLLEQRGGLVLDVDVDVDGGGTWRIEARSSARRLLGRQVRVTGTREEFDLLAVRTIEPA